MKTATGLPRLFIYYVATLLFLAVGAITSPNLTWYRSLTLPSFMPSDVTVAILWGVLFLATAASFTLLWERSDRDRTFHTTIGLFMLNGLLVLLWNFLFFGLHMLDLASTASVVVGASVVAIMLHVRRISPKAALLLTPYLLWMIFAVYFNHIVTILNP